MALSRERLAALTSAGPLWGGRACNPLEQTWAAVSALTSGRPRRPTRACTPRKASIDEERRPKDEGIPPDRLMFLYKDFLLYVDGIGFIGKEASWTDNCPEKSCFAGSADTTLSTGVQNKNRRGTKITETDWLERVIRNILEVVMTGGPTHTTVRGHASTPNVEQARNVRIQPPKFQDHINITVYPNTSGLEGGITVVNGRTTIAGGSRPEGNGGFPRATGAVQGTRDGELTEVTIAAKEKDQAYGDSSMMNMRMIAIPGSVMVNPLTSAMATKEVEASQASTNLGTASPVAVVAPRRPLTESSSSSSWPRRAGGLAAKDVAHIVNRLKEGGRAAPSPKFVPTSVRRKTGRT